MMMASGSALPTRAVSSGRLKTRRKRVLTCADSGSYQETRRRDGEDRLGNVFLQHAVVGEGRDVVPVLQGGPQ
jgi:hypothetical protein